ncbi:MAG TPA: hydantoinase/oxoprolinase family protein, partial [Bacillota bacterium]|nr:hydantoinase/oxoprolinase family protein [Bacillota bacterium]
MRLATDIGGTFTDLVYVDEETGAVGLAKAPSTPPAFGQGILDAIAHTPLQLEAVQHFVHGCTVVINALTERRGARTGLVTTRGFRDVLAIGRANRPDIYNMRFRKQPPFVPREHRFEVTERLDYRGEVVTPLHEDEVRAVAEDVRSEGLQALGVCFLHSYANPAHERACAELLRALLPGVFVSTSCEITQEWREYERTSTVVLNAFVQPVTASYLADLEAALRQKGMGCQLNVMKSNGGTHTFELAKSQPIHLVESGPVGGVIGARAVGAALGLGNVISIDVGGTTAKTSLID